MKSIAAKVRLLLSCAGVVALLALPGAALGFDGCACDGCRSTPDGCFKSDKCVNEICNWNGAPCSDGCAEPE